MSCDPESPNASSVYDSESLDSERLETKVERVHLEWQGLCCSYNGSHGKIVVLQDIWGAALAGEMQVCTAAATLAISLAVSSSCGLRVRMQCSAWPEKRGTNSLKSSKGP